MTQEEQVIIHLQKLFWAQFGCDASELKALPSSGSKRQYFRLSAGAHQAIGAYNRHPKENKAFVQFARHFHGNEIAVPRIYGEDLKHDVYLQEDLGGQSLLGLLLAARAEKEDLKPVWELYKKSLASLAQLQTKGAEALDYKLCFNGQDFDKAAMLWDLNYFKYYFLRVSGLEIDESKLEADFEALATYLAAVPRTTFMFRDFQGRNILVKEGNPFFIDFQGGKRGALAYDVVSILYQAKARIPASKKAELLYHYIQEVKKYTKLQSNFQEQYEGFVLLRTLQVLGAYGLRGLIEGKAHFKESIPLALDNLKGLLEHWKLPLELPYLRECLSGLIASDRFAAFDKSKGEASPLLVDVCSFSYKKSGVPKDSSGHGGGFVYDCRALHNPGRYTPYKQLTGRDESVIQFLEAHSEMPQFMEEIYKTVGRAVENYVARDFDYLSVSFGCTGGQHRSVYAADALTKYLRKQYGVEVHLVHKEQAHLSDFKA